MHPMLSMSTYGLSAVIGQIHLRTFSELEEPLLFLENVLIPINQEGFGKDGGTHYFMFLKREKQDSFIAMLLCGDTWSKLLGENFGQSLLSLIILILDTRHPKIEKVLMEQFT